MKSILPIVCLLVGLARPDPPPAPGPWKHLTFFGQEGLVSSIAFGKDRIAVGLTAGAVRLMDPNMDNTVTIWDAVFGTRGKVWSLAWYRGDLWIAAGRGLFRYDATTASLDRSQRFVPDSMKTGVKLLREQGDALWCASSRSLGRLGDPMRGEYQEWKLPVTDEPTALLKVGNRIFVGTSTRGLLMFDSSSGEWSRFGQAEGLSSEQVTGLEWIGDQVFVSTPEGVDALDLSSRQIRVVVLGLMAGWMAQVNGSLMVTSFDGLFRVDPTTFESTPVLLPKGSQPEGDLRYGLGVLVVGTRSELLVRDQPTLLGREVLRPDSDGFRIGLPRKITADVQIRAFMRLPEWPTAKFPMAVQAPRSGSEWCLKLPPDIRGNVQIDLIAQRGSHVEEVRSFEAFGDRMKPNLDMEKVRAIVRDSEVVVSGKASGIGPLRLVLRPENRNLSMDSAGAFRQRLRLGSGENRFELVLVDGIGNRITRGIIVRRDDNAPDIERAAAVAKPSESSSIHVVRYRMLEGETISKVSKKFYGSIELDTVLMRWNGFMDSTKWRQMPIGTVVDIPFWTDIDQADASMRAALESFPWDKLPSADRARR